MNVRIRKLNSLDLFIIITGLSVCVCVCIQNTKSDVFKIVFCRQQRKGILTHNE